MAIDLTTLVDSENGLLDPRAYISEELYQLELEHIFGRAWCFLAHDSLLPKTGDFIQTYIGEDPVLVVRQRDGGIKAFLNQCRHRGMRICRADQGNIKAFTCTYHGWTYDISGRLINVPHEEDGYHNELDKDAWGPIQVAKLENYKGFWFGTWDASAPSLEEYLGDMKWYFDAHFDRWAGGVEFLPGYHVRWVIDCNWKFAAEQFGGDAYHAPISHASATMVLAPQRAQINGTDQETEMQRSAEQRRLGMINGRQFSAPQGHGTGGVNRVTANDRVNANAQMGAATRRWREEHEAETIARLGELRPTGHANIFPNCSYGPGTQMRVWHPRGPNQIEVHTWLYVPKDAPDEVKMEIRSNGMRTFNPAGLFEQDDGENWNEIQKLLRGYKSRTTRWNAQLGMGHLGRGVDGLPGVTADSMYAEHAGRGIYQRWADMLSADSWSDLASIEERRQAIPV
jgi:3-phenylpropionate/trans-cinnamate dioxygenase alpha subunit